MCVPVLRALFMAHPKLILTVVGHPNARALFEEFDHVQFFAVDFKGKHKGVKGLWRLYVELKTIPHQAVADLNAVWHTHILRFFYLTTTKRFVQLNKGRKEKQALIRTKNKILRPLPHTVYRYAAVFQKLGIAVDPATAEAPETPELPKGLPQALEHSTKKWIGIAPFASSEGKTYPLDLMQQVVAYLQKEYQVLLFGAGHLEEKQFTVWENAYPNVNATSTTLALKAQLDLIAQLDVMIAMDDAYGHFAANAGIPVLTLWGLTHPYLGTAPFGAPLNCNLVADREKFPGIPIALKGSSIPPGYEAAFRTITPKAVLEKVLEIVQKRASPG